MQYAWRRGPAEIGDTSTNQQPLAKLRLQLQDASSKSQTDYSIPEDVSYLRKSGIGRYSRKISRSSTEKLSYIRLEV